MIKKALTINFVYVLPFFMFFMPSIGFSASFLGAKGRALGGGGRAAHLGTESPLLNPAIFPKDSNVHLGGLFHAQNLEGQQQQSAGILVIDQNASALFPALLVYQKGRVLSDKRIAQNWDYWKFSFRQPLQNTPTNSAFWGASLNYLKQKDSLLTSDVGFFWQVSPQFSVGGVWEEALSSENLSSLSFAERGVHLGLGMAYHYASRSQLIADVQLAQQALRNIMLGLDIHLYKNFYVRGGGRFSPQFSRPSPQVYAIGGGWVGPKLAFNYTYESSPTILKISTHAFNMLIYF